MSGGHYPSVNRTRSSQEFVAPRHRLPVIAPPRTPSPFTSTSSISHAHTSHALWMNKHNFSSNFHDDSGYYGHTVPRDYSSISRAHCNEESSAWSNPHFSNPLGNPPFGGVTANENMNVKDDIQQESMDLSAGHHTTPNIKSMPFNTLPVNGDTSRRSSKDLNIVRSTISESSKNTKIAVDKKESTTSVIATNPSSTEQPISEDLNLLTRDPVVSSKNEQSILPSDNVEFALESMFQSDNRSPVSCSSSVIVSTLTESSKDLGVESVEKILKSPSPEKDDDNDNLAILDDSNNENVTDMEVDSVRKSLVENTAYNTSVADNSKVVDVKSKNCDNSVKANNSKIVETSSSKIKPTVSKYEKSNEVKPIEKGLKNCDLRNEPDQISLQQVPSSSAVVISSKKDVQVEGKDSTKSTTRNNALAKNIEPEKNSASFIKPLNNNVRNEEITYVEVENELEKMFAGIEDTTVNGTDKDSLTKNRQDLLSASIDAQNNLSISSATTPSQSSTSLFGNVSIPAKTSKKKASKKSKSTNSSTKSTKDNKQKSSSSVKESSLDNVAMKRVPVIHIEGSKENPISAYIINSIKLEEDDVNDGRTSAKRKLGKKDRVVKKSANNYAIKNYDPGTSDASWTCVFCNLSAHTPGMAGEPTGDLFGPYFIRTPEQINADDDAKRFSRKANHAEQGKRKQKRSLSVESGYMDSSSSEEQKSFEIWAHENCIVWAPGVHLIGSKLIGLEEAVMQALDTLCAHCSNKGASIGCRARHCNSCAHYSCALYTGWKLDPETFISTCSVHSVPD